MEYKIKRSMEKVKNLPVLCPSCGERLQVAALHCPECQTRIEGDYTLPLLLRLTAEEQRFIYDFVCASGSLKQMAAQMELSYPTVRNRLDEIIGHIKILQQ